MTWIRVNNSIFDLEKVSAISLNEGEAKIMLWFDGEDDNRTMVCASKEEARQAFERVSKQLTDKRKGGESQNDSTSLTRLSDVLCGVVPPILSSPSSKVLNKNDHALLIDKVNAGMLYVDAVEKFDKTCAPSWQEDKKAWRCICPTCTPSLL